MSRLIHFFPVFIFLQASCLVAQSCTLSKPKDCVSGESIEKLIVSIDQRMKSTYSNAQFDGSEFNFAKVTKPRFYQSGFCALDSIGVNFDSCIGFYLVEGYDWHDNLRLYYLTAETTTGDFLIVSNEGSTSGSTSEYQCTFLGITEKNYFKKQFDLLVTCGHQPVEERYLFMADLRKDLSVRDITVLTPSSISAINQIALIEKLLFGRHK